MIPLAGAVVGIWGFGAEGASMARMAASAGAARIEAVDDGSRSTGPPPEADLPGLVLSRGTAALPRLAGCDVVFVSPGVPWGQPFFAELRARGTPVSSAADWYLSRHAARTIGVTGTKGKSTTASLLGALLTRMGVPVVVGGNIGTPLSDLSPAGDTVVVAELSSQQAALLRTSPAVAVITNLFADHLDWHGDRESYHRAKANVFAHGARALVTTPQVCDALAALGGLVLPPVVRLPELAGLPPLGGVMAREHNRANGVLAAAAAAELLGRAVSDDELRLAAADFTGLPHRLQTVRTRAGTRWVDDTLATTPESVVAALRATAPGERVVLIVGGLDRGLDYGPVEACLAAGEREVTLIQAPSNGTDIGRGFARTHPERTVVVDGLEAAVRAAAAVRPDVVLLSPGAASYDLYPNYVAKGAAFERFIDALPPERARTG